MTHAHKSKHSYCWRTGAIAATMFLAALSLCASSLAAQNQKKNKKEKPADDSTSASLVHLPDPQAIDHTISEMLGYWQIGDLDSLHKYFADDVATISGAWEPPLFGWDAYSKAYQTQRARIQGGRMDRINTYTKVTGDTAWSTYQWRFAGQVDGKPVTAVGHTTLMFERRKGAWVIVMNHTSEVASGAPDSPTSTAPQQTAPAAATGPSINPGL